ncbi:MAG: FecR domain-containing protein [Bacteroidetes bacterium]|nr:FecR domain-containing protein [Bacteroidota bacterium]
MKYLFTFLLLLLQLAAAQKKEITFSAGALYAVSKNFTGDSTAWPLVVALAQRNVETNSFTLSPNAVRQLKEFAPLHKSVREGNEYFHKLLKAGARVFAPEKLAEAAALSSEYEAGIQQGNLVSLSRAGRQYKKVLNAIADEIKKKRNEDIDALIAEKNGVVDKRKGFLGQWKPAVKGDMLTQSDGVKTGRESFAQLAFTDGCEVMIDPNSTVVIRESKMDKLDQTVVRSVALEKGALLAKLTENAKERSSFTFQAGTSESQVKSGKFWASAIEERRVKLSNYDGTINVTANKQNVRLAQNEGTIVEKGKAPLPPVTLLSPPQLAWNGIDSVIYNSSFTFQWNTVAHSTAYTVELCKEREFKTTIQSYTTAKTELEVTSIDLGNTFVRLVAVDKFGLRGIESSVYRLIRAEDNIPPPIYVDGWETDRRYSALSSLAITGSTEADAKFVVNDQPIKLGKEGAFSFTTSVEQKEKQLILKATDRSGNTRERILSLVAVDTNRVKAVEWNCPVKENILSPKNDEITARGTAYPLMKIIVHHGTQSTEVQTDSQGNWAVSVQRISGAALEIIFESIADHVVVLKKIYQVY